MLQRLRYRKVGDNYVSIGNVKNVNGHEFVVGFSGGDPKTPCTGFIKSAHDDTVKIPLEATSHHKIKIKIKKALSKLGCAFNVEARKKRKQINETQSETTESNS